MKKTILMILVLLMVSGGIRGQERVKSFPRTCNGIGFIPSNVGHLNGWAIGWLMLGSDESDYPQVINGMYTNPSPLAIGIGAISFPFMLVGFFDFNEYEKNVIDPPNGPENKINGLSLTFFDFSKRYSVNGLQLSVYADIYRFKGLSIAGAMTGYSDFRGVMISSLWNKSYTGKGLQIALFNRVHDMQGVQIGLVNKIGKRTLPFVNFNFKKSTKVIVSN